jgi:hypothetical protein
MSGLNENKLDELAKKHGFKRRNVFFVDME